MQVNRIKHTDGNGHYTTFASSDFEYVNPINYYKEAIIKMNCEMSKDILLMQQLPFLPGYMEELIYREAEKDWENYYQQVTSTKVPEVFIELLSCQKKKDQVKLLKNSSIKPAELLAFIFKAWDAGFSFSQYTAEHYSSGLDVKELPKVIEVDGNQVKKIGDTQLSDGALKQAVDHRKVTISKFLDNGESWHCLFLTFSSLRGDESWKGGQPHYHYISDKFGFKREDVVNQLKSREYSLGSLPHIDFLDYRN